jgi:hypothetical protein
MVREKAPTLGRTFRLDTSAGFGKRASMRFQAHPLPLPVAGRGLSTTFLRAPCPRASGLADKSAPTLETAGRECDGAPGHGKFRWVTSSWAADAVSAFPGCGHAAPGHWAATKSGRRQFLRDRNSESFDAAHAV